MRKIIGIFGHEPIEERFQIAARGRIGILHHDEATTRVLNKNSDCPVSHVAPVDLRLHIIGDFVKSLSVGAKLKFVMVNAHRERFEVLFCHSDRSGGISDLISLLAKNKSYHGDMKIHVQFYAQLRDLVGMRELDLDLAEGATVHDLLEKIYAQQPALRSHDKSILIGAGVEFVDRNYELKPNEEIAIMPPVQGG